MAFHTSFRFPVKGVKTASFNVAFPSQLYYIYGLYESSGISTTKTNKKGLIAPNMSTHRYD